MRLLGLLKSVLVGFLGTYTSRYSGLDGYWLFGFLLDAPAQLRFDLLAGEPEPGGAQAVRVARDLARAKFAEQLAKAQVPRSQLRSASLLIERPATAIERPVASKMATPLPGVPLPRHGYDLRLRAEVVTVSGHSVANEMTLFVAPHSPEHESRSARAS